MPAALTLSQVFCSRVSIELWLVYQRSWVLRPSVNRMMTWLYLKFGSSAGMVKGDAVSDCQPICKPIAWLVLPTGCIAVILFDSAVQSLDSPISDTGQEVYCSVGYNVLPAIGTS